MVLILKSVPSIGENATKVTESLMTFLVISILKLLVSALGEFLSLFDFNKS